MHASKARKGLDPLVYQLYKAAKSNTPSRRLREETQSILEAATNAIKDSFTPDDLSVLAWSASKIGHTSPKFWRVAINLTEVYAQDFSTRSATRLLEAFSLGMSRGSWDPQRPANALLGLFAEPPREPLTEQGVCQLLRALVNLKMIDAVPSWLLQESIRLLDGSVESTVKAEPPRCLVPPLMWPLSRIPATADEAASKVALLIRGGRVDYTQMTTTDVALLIHSLAKAWHTAEEALQQQQQQQQQHPYPPYRDVMSQLVTECGARGWKGLKPRAIAGVLWACGRCSVKSLLEECTEDWHPLMEVDLKSFDPQALANLLWGIGRINKRQLPCWIPVDGVEAAFRAQSSNADLFSVSMIACALAYEESCDVDGLFAMLWEFVHKQLHRPSELEKCAGDLAGLLWAFSRRGHFEAVLELAPICQESLLSLPVDLQALALWGMAHAGISLPEQLGRELLTSIHRPTASPPSSAIITSLAALDQLCPKLNTALPPNLDLIIAADLWRLSSMRNAPVQQRREALALAIRQRENAPAYAAVYLAGCLDPYVGFLPSSTMRLRLLRDFALSGLEKCPSRSYVVGIRQCMSARIPAAVARLASVSKTPSERIKVSPKLKGIFNAALLATERDFSPEALAKIAWSCAKLKHQDETFYSQLSRLTSNHVTSFSLHTAAIFLEPVALYQSPWPLDCIEMLIRQLAVLREVKPDARDICRVLTSLARLRLCSQPPEWVVQASLEIIRGENSSIVEAGAYEARVQQVCWALARIPLIRLDLVHDAFASAINSHKLVPRQMTCGQVASIIHSLALCSTKGLSDPHGFSDSLLYGMEALIDDCYNRGWQQFTSSQISRIFWACGKCSYRGIITRSTLTDNPLRHIDSMDFKEPVEIVNIIWASRRLTDNSVTPWPPWCNSVHLVMHSGTLPSMSLHDLAIIASSLAKVEDDAMDGLFDGIWDQLQNVLSDTFRTDRDASNLASILWSLSWRCQSDRVRLLSPLLEDSLSQLPSQTQGIALWGLANAGLHLSAQAAAEVQRSIIARPITVYTANALINLWVLRPSQRIVFPSTLSNFSSADLWKLVSIRSAPLTERRRVLSLALRQRANTPSSAAAYYAGCLTTDEGFLLCTSLRLHLLRSMLKADQMSPKYLTKLACHLSELI